ncbi:hypothetical protein J4227_00060 [Candidatus Woesearchaeota archaeon]|nr:hypothetical protein [Candidatus Woesearchaeota archaeon]
MKQWDAKSEDVSRITPEMEKAKSLLLLVALRQKDLRTKEKSEEFATLVVETYYEIVKELITAIMSIDGYKTLSHETLVSYLWHYADNFGSSQIFLIDQLRKTRNDIAYRGIMISPEYLKRNKEQIHEIISKLKRLTESKLKGR